MKMKKRFAGFAALCLLLLTFAASAADRPEPFDFSQLEEGALCPMCHDGVIYLADGGEVRADERCPLSGYHHVITVQALDWSCTGCGMHFARASHSAPISFFCVEPSCPDARNWRQAQVNP